MKFLSSILRSIVAVKSSALESSLFRRYSVLRDRELTEAKNYRTRFSFVGLFHNTVFGTPIVRQKHMGLSDVLALLRICTFGAFALVAVRSDAAIFAYQPVFVCLAVLEAIAVIYFESVDCSAWLPNLTTCSELFGALGKS